MPHANLRLVSHQHFGPRRVVRGRAVLRLLGVLLVLLIWGGVRPDPGWAQEQDASMVAGDYLVRGFRPAATVAGPDPAACWGDLAVGDTVTVAAAGPDVLTVTLPAGWTWQLERTRKDPDLAVQSSWTGTDEDRLERWASSSLDFTGGLIYVELEYGLNSSATFCAAELVAEAPVDEAPLDPGNGDTPAAPTDDQLGVSLACQHDFDDGRVECTATPTQPADTYDWWFDGTPQTATTGPELLMSDVPPGSHHVGVVARDTVNGLTSPPDTLTFTTTIPDSGGGLPSLPAIPLLVGAGALAAGAAAFAARKMRRPAVVAGAPVPAGTAPLGAPMPPGGRRPPAPRESLPVQRQPDPHTRSASTASSTAAPPKPHRPPERLPAALRGDATPPAVKSATARPAHTPKRPRPAPAPATPRERAQQSTFFLEATASQPRVAGHGRDEVIVSVRAFRRVDGAVTDVTSELTTVSGTSSNEKKLRVPTFSGTDFAVRGTHIGTMEFPGSVTIDATSVRGEHAQTTLQLTVVPATLEVQITTEKAGFRDGTVTVNLPHACARIKGSVVTAGFAGLSAFTGQVTDGPVVDARCAASMRVDTVPWSSPRAVYTEPDGSFWFAIPNSVLSVFGTDTNDYTLPPTRQVKMGADDEVRQLLRGYDVALQDFVADLESPVGPPYGDVIRDCMGYPARFLEQLRTGPRCTRPPRWSQAADRWLALE